MSNTRPVLVSAVGLDPQSLAIEVERLKQLLSMVGSSTAERQRLLQAVVDTAAMAIVVVDQAGTIVFVNAEAKELLFDGTQAEGKNYLKLLSGAPEHLQAALLSESDVLFAHQGLGETETYAFSRREFSLGGFPHNLLVIQNLSLELSRRESAIVRRTVGVLRKELGKAFGPVSALLQSVRATAGSAQFRDEFEQTLTRIEKRVRRMDSLLKGLSAFEELPEPAPREVAWLEFFARLTPLLAGVTVEEPPDGIGWFDPDQIEQVLGELIKNALEAGSAAEDIRLEVVMAPGGGYRASVMDRGRGLSDEALENAMAPSFTTKPASNGMGLAICREILDAHGGRLGVTRRSGGGAAVSLWLPPKDRARGATARARFGLTRG
jgi:two-component system, NtrC family, nitrogen regulation sensor histidine kinase NtrY